MQLGPLTNQATVERSRQLLFGSVLVQACRFAPVTFPFVVTTVVMTTSEIGTRFSFPAVKAHHNEPVGRSFCDVIKIRCESGYHGN